MAGTSTREVTDTTLRREVGDNFRRLFHFRDMFGDVFVGRQAWACLQLLGGLASEF